MSDRIDVTKIRKCEGCGLISATREYVSINLTNGGLTLCRQCLDEFNAKNPELPVLRSEIARLRASLTDMIEGAEWEASEYQGRADSFVRIAAAKAVLG